MSTNLMETTWRRRQLVRRSLVVEREVKRLRLTRAGCYCRLSDGREVRAVEDVTVRGNASPCFYCALWPTAANLCPYRRACMAHWRADGRSVVFVAEGGAEGAREASGAAPRTEPEGGAEG